MAKVSVSEECIVNMMRVLQEARAGLEDSVVYLKKIYYQSEREWNDKQYRQLGDIIERVSRDILLIGCELGGAKEKLKKLQTNIQNYIDSGKAQNGRNYTAYVRSDNVSPNYSFDEVINNFQRDTWNTLGNEARQECISSLAYYVTSDLQLNNPPRINYYYREPSNGAISYGFYNSRDNTININTYTMDNPTETADTVAHELRHAWQRERAANPISEEDRIFAHNFRNYIRHEIDPARYRNQPVERDARQYAENLTSMII